MKNQFILQAVIFIVFCGIAPSFGQDPSEEAQRYFVRGLTAVKTAKSPDDYAAAIKEFESAVRLAPDWPKAWYNLGIIQKEAGKPIGAITSLRKYLELAPDASNSATVKAMLYEFEYTVEKEAGELLTAKGVNLIDLNSKDKDGIAPLHKAAGQGDIELVGLLLLQGADINTKDNVDNTPLHWAINNNQNKMADFLITKGANIDAKDNSGWTPMHRAVYQDQIGMVELLITKGADMNAKDKTDNTPLHWASYEDQKEIAELLIAKGADMNIRDQSGRTALDCATSNNHKAMADVLIKHGALKGRELPNLYKKNIQNTEKRKIISPIRLQHLVILLFLIIPFIDILKSKFKGNNKLVWLIVVVIVPIIGPILYFFIGRKQKLNVKAVF